MSNGPITVFIADESDMFRIAFRQVMAESNIAVVVGEASNGPAALEGIAALRPQVAFIKNTLPELDGIKVCRQLKKMHLPTGIIIVLHNEADFFDALSASADGYMHKEVTSFSLPVAVRSVAAGGCWLGPRLAEYLLRGDGRSNLKSGPTRALNPIALETLTTKEKDVVRLMVEGRSNQAIAESLGLSVETVRVHVKHILKKLDARDRQEASEKVVRGSTAYARPRLQPSADEL